MLVLVANAGSGSLNYKLLDMDAAGAEIAGGEYGSIGLAESAFPSHAHAVEALVGSLARKPAIIGFRVVHGGPISGAVQVNDDVLAAMEQFADLAPAHNPACIATMKAFREKLPGVPQVAVFETAFHQTIPLSRQVYSVPLDWIEKLNICRYGFHGTAHRHVALRVVELMGKEARRIISCRLGNSCSVCAIENGKSAACSFGMNGISTDLREVEAAAGGDERAKLALDAFVEAVRQCIGAYLVVLGGCDVLVFTGSMGENNISLREAICRNLEWAKIELDGQKNQVRGKEAKISKVESGAEIWILPADEEILVAEQAVAAMMVN